MPFTCNKTSVDGLLIIEPVVFNDERGYFMESFKKSDFVHFGINVEFLQDNHSYSVKNVLRGLHYQKYPFAQAKLVRVLKGKVWDIAVDIRRDSPSFKKWIAVELSEDNKKMFYIPEGFAHGFLALSDDVHLMYKCSSEYSVKHDAGIRWNDPELNIPWPVKHPVISEKDINLPLLNDAEVF
jgi:dTDP-4-dehydrorhamnose 3,5-epimerase